MPSFHVLALLGLLSLCDFSEAVSIPMGLSLAKQPDVQFDSGLFDELLEVISEDEPLFVDNDIAEDDNVFSDSGLFEELLEEEKDKKSGGKGNDKKFAPNGLFADSFPTTILDDFKEELSRLTSGKLTDTLAVNLYQPGRKQETLEAHSASRESELQCLDLNDYLSGSGLSFAKLWEEASLLDTLKPGSNYTIMVPTEEAFKDKNLILTKNDTQTDSLLLRHVLPGRLPLQDLAHLNSVQTASCDVVEVGKKDMGVTVSDCLLTASEHEICGFELHMIDCVLQRPDLPFRQSETLSELCL